MGIVLSIIVMIICGVVTKNINTNKGYDGGFAWGFFLGIIGIIIVAVRSDAPAKKTETVSTVPVEKAAIEEKFTNCPKCGEKNPEGSSFCRSCGADLKETWKCECGAENSNDSKFCSQCGKKKEDPAENKAEENPTEQN